MKPRPHRFNTGGAVAGAPSTYLVDGKQYVAMASGNASRSAWKTTRAMTLIVFISARKTVAHMRKINVTSPEPLKLIGLLSRRPDLTLGQFSQHWRTRHRDLSLLLIAPGIMHGYVQNHRRSDADPIPGLPLAGDGFPELWTSGADVLARLGAAPEYLQGAYLDESNFMDGRSQALLAREIVIDDGPGRVAAPSLVKVMLFFKRAVGAAGAEFARGLQGTRHPILMPEGRPMRLIRHEAIELPSDAGATYDGVQTYAGEESSYWPDIATFLAAWNRRGPAPDYVDAKGTVGVIVREEPVLFPIHTAQ